MSERNLKSIGLPAFNFTDRKFTCKQAKRENPLSNFCFISVTSLHTRSKKNPNNFAIACIGDIIWRVHKMSQVYFKYCSFQGQTFLGVLTTRQLAGSLFISKLYLSYVCIWFSLLLYRLIIKNCVSHQRNTQNQHGPKEKRTASFLWTIEKFLEFLSLQRTKKEPLTSQTFAKTGHRWRGVIDNNSFFLQLRACSCKSCDSTYKVNPENFKSISQIQIFTLNSLFGSPFKKDMPWKFSTALH